jgi:Fe-S cluster assembly protein SufD
MTMATPPRANPQPADDPFLTDHPAMDRHVDHPRWLEELRLAGRSHYHAVGLPTTRDEDWRLTNLKWVRDTAFRWSAEPASPVPEARLASFDFPGLACLRLVFVDGRLSPSTPREGPLPQGVVVRSLARALREHPELVRQHLASIASPGADAFNALNTAYIEDGLFVHVPDGVHLDRPIHALHLSSGQAPARVSHLRHLVVLGRGAEATVIEDYAALRDEPAMTNALTEMRLAPGAVGHHYLIERESRQAFSLSTLEVDQGAQSRFESHSLLIGGRVVRNNKRPVLSGEGCDSLINGLYIAGRDQHHDSAMRVRHAQPRGHSRQFYKGILEDNGRTVFSGRIVVDRGAQKTDAKQSNQNLLLCDEAAADARPQLEIYADDVKCTHGATVGEIDQEAMFYLRSRGLPQTEAFGLLIYAFAGEVLDRMSLQGVRQAMERLVLRHLPQGLVGHIQ